ncbi:hypothetical protein CTA1_7318, partial [Colletotrichum tanaceti]
RRRPPRRRRRRRRRQRGRIAPPIAVAYPPARSTRQTHIVAVRSVRPSENPSHRTRPTNGPPPPPPPPPHEKQKQNSHGTARSL